MSFIMSVGVLLLVLLLAPLLVNRLPLERHDYLWNVTFLVAVFFVSYCVGSVLAILGGIV